MDICSDIRLNREMHCGFELAETVIKAKKTFREQTSFFEVRILATGKKNCHV
jgi:hypothetical protein